MLQHILGGFILAGAFIILVGMVILPYWSGDRRF